MHGRGGHGSRPETTVDPVVMAAATISRLQTVVSREVAGADAAVLTVGYVQAGNKANIIPAEARLGINIRTFSAPVRDRVVAAMTRIINAEADASGAGTPPEITLIDSFPVLVNEPAATEHTAAAFRGAFGDARVIDPGPVTGSEDVGYLATALDVPLVYWVLGGADPVAFATAAAEGRLDSDVPSNHSPHFAPVIQPTLDTGVAALVTAARAWLRVT